MTQQKSLLSDTATYSALGFGSKLATLITFPILANSFSPAEFGFFDFSSTIIAFSAILVCFGQDSAYGRICQDKNDNPSLVSTICISHLFNYIIFGIILHFAVELTPQFFLFKGHISEFQFKAYILFATFTLFSFNLFLNIFKWLRMKREYITVTIINLIVSIAIIILALEVYNVRIGDFLFLSTLPWLLSSIYGGSIAIKLTIRPPTLEIYTEVMRLAIPYGIVCVLGVSLTVIDRYIVSLFHGSDRLGDYAVAVRFVSILVVINAAFQTAWRPLVLSTQDFAQKMQLIAFGYVCFSTLLSITYSVIFLNINWIMSALGIRGYELASIYFFYLGAATVMICLAKIVDVGIIEMKSIYRPYIPLAAALTPYLFLLYHEVNPNSVLKLFVISGMIRLIISWILSGAYRIPAHLFIPATSILALFVFWAEGLLGIQF